MGLKSIILIFYCIQICLTYPIDDNQGISNEARCSNQFTNSNPFNHESVPIANQEFLNFPNSIEPVTYINHGGNKPFGIPNLPSPIPDDVEVFAPLEPSGPPRPYPPGSHPHRPHPPRPIPNSPQPNPDVGVFSPDDGKLIPFPNRDVLGSNIEIPVVLEREQFRVIPEHIERDIQIVPGLIKSEGPVMIEKQDNVFLPKEQGQMMPMMVENVPSQMPSMVIERVDRPIMIESEHPQMIPIIDNQQTLIVERDRQKDLMPMEMEKEQNFHPHVTPSMENEATVESEHPKELVPIVIEKETIFLKQVETPQMTHFKDNERNLGFEERNPTEFVPIPQQLPERMKRDKNSISNGFATSDSAPTTLREKLINELDRQSVEDNEIMQHEGTSTTSSNTKNETTKFENILTASPQPLEIELNGIPSTTNTSESKILEINHNISTLTIEEHNTHEQLSTEHIPITPQPLNDKEDEKPITSTSILNDTIENENTNRTAPADEAINHKGLNDAAQVITHADEISTTSIHDDIPHQTSTTEDSKIITEKILDFLSKNKTITNQNTSDTPHSINSTVSLDNEKLFNSSILITSESKYPIPVIESETIPQLQTQTNVHHIIADLTPIKQQFVPPIYPIVSYIPSDPYQEIPNFMNYGYGSPYGNINQYNYGVHALGQLYPSSHLDYYKSKL